MNYTPRVAPRKRRRVPKPRQAVVKSEPEPEPEPPVETAPPPPREFQLHNPVTAAACIAQARRALESKRVTPQAAIAKRDDAQSLAATAQKRKEQNVLHQQSRVKGATEKPTATQRRVGLTDYKWPEIKPIEQLFPKHPARPNFDKLLDCSPIEHSNYEW